MKLFFKSIKFVKKFFYNFFSTEKMLKKIELHIKKNNLFDYSFYTSTYKAILPSSILNNYNLALNYYFKNGIKNAQMPSSKFDPALFFYKNFPYKCKLNLFSFLSFNNKNNKLNSRFISLIKKYKLIKYSKRSNFDYFISYSKIESYVNFCNSNQSTKKFKIKFSRNKFNLISPGSNFFIQKIKENKPFCFARLPHGFWDALFLIEEIKEHHYFAKLPLKYRKNLATRILYKARPHHGIYIEGFLDELLYLIKNKNNKKNFYKAISFKGYSDFDHKAYELSNLTKINRNYICDTLEYLFVNSNNLYDASYPKNLVSWGRMDDLMKVARKHHVYVIGSMYLRDLYLRANLRFFKHIEIMEQCSQAIRYEILEKIKDILAVENGKTNKRHNILLFEAGTLSYWLISQLHIWNPNNFYLDMGQSFSVFYPDRVTNPWFKLHLSALPYLKNH